jgi:hypothetical protein
LKYIIEEYRTDGCSYGYDLNHCIEFDGSKDELALIILDNCQKSMEEFRAKHEPIGSKKRHEHEYNNFEEVLKYHEFDVFGNKKLMLTHENGLQIENILYTLDEWFESNKIN